MCEEDCEQALEEYRKVIKNLFLLVLDRNDTKLIELFRLKMQVERDKHRRDMEAMQKAVKDG